MKPASYWKDQLCNRFIINTKDNVIEEFIKEIQKDALGDLELNEDMKRFLSICTIDDKYS